jgi:hypothetical protein
MSSHIQMLSQCATVLGYSDLLCIEHLALWHITYITRLRIAVTVNFASLTSVNCVLKSGADHICTPYVHCQCDQLALNSEACVAQFVL